MSYITTEQFDSLLRTADRIASALEAIANAVDVEKNALRMYDVERANVYKTHLGEKLRTEQTDHDPSCSSLRGGACDCVRRIPE